MRLYIAIVLLMCCISTTAQTLLIETFSSAYDTIPPQGWQVVRLENSGNFDQWRFDNPYQVENSDSTFASFAGFFYSDDGISEASALESPSFSCPRDSITLRFSEYFYRHDSSALAQIQISVDQGKQWRSITSNDFSESYELFVKRKIDITTYATGQKDVRLRFVASSNGSIAWLIDNIAVVAGETTPPLVIHDAVRPVCSQISIPIRATVTDASGVDAVHMIYSVDEGIADTLNLYSSGNDIYQGQLNVPDNQGIIHYTVQATDQSVNRNNVDLANQKGGIFHFYYGVESAPFTTKDIEDAEIPFVVVNPDQAYGWEVSSHAGGFGLSGHSLMMNFYDNDSIGQRDYLNSTYIELPASPHVLNFDLAYAPYEDQQDILKVKVSTDGGGNWEEVYVKKGVALATAAPTEESFIPAVADEWKRETVNLNPYAGQCILISIEATSDFGNNLYLDNLLISEGSIEEKYILKQNYPNPAVEWTTIEIEAPYPSWVNVSLYDIRGRKTFVAKEFLENSGLNKVQLATNGQRPGLYVYQITTPTGTYSQRMIIAD